MNCPYCGKDTDAQSPFCVHCGSPLPQERKTDGEVVSKSITVF